MKTLLTINNLINDQIESILELEKDKKLNKTKIKKGRNNLTYLRFIKSYLETNPDESNLIRDRDKLIKNINSKQSNYDYWFKHIAPIGITKKKAEELFKKESGIETMKKQLKNLNFILDENN